MLSPGKPQIRSFIEPYHRPLVWAGGAAFFGFPLLSAFLGDAGRFALLWLVPALLLPAVACSSAALAASRSSRPQAAAGTLLLALALSGGWFLAGSAALRLDHEDALRRPVITASGAGRLEAVALGEASGRRGTERILPVRLRAFLPETAAESTGSVTGRETAASGELELALRGGGGVLGGGYAPVRGSGVSIDLTAEELSALAAGDSLGTIDGSRLLITPPTGALAHLRGSLRGDLRRLWRRLGPRGGGLARALLLGERHALDPGILELFRRAGAMHLLALSGMHLGVLAGILGLLSFPLLGRKGLLPAAALLCGYYWLVGPIPSLLRALLMFCLAALLRARGVPVDPRSLLAAALLIALLLEPELATSLGWRLSTLALVGILWIGAPLSLRGPKLPGRPIWALLWVSIGAMVATAGTSFAVFGAIYPASPLSSLLLTPLVLLFIWLALLLLPLSLVAPGVVPILGSGATGVYELLVSGGAMLARIPPLSTAAAAPLTGGILLGLLLLYGTPWLRLRRRLDAAPGARDVR